MRLSTLLLITGLVFGLGFSATAELQNVLVGGEIRIRGNYYNMSDDDDDGLFDWDLNDALDEVAFSEMRTRVNVKADFTDDVSAFIELDSYDILGEDFRSNYVSGIDGRACSNDDVEVYQAYIEAKEMWGTPLNMRVGRQELSLGSEWLVGTNDTTAFFTGLSFDAIMLNYATDMVSISAIASKLAEGFDDFGDSDADLYAVYGSYLGLEDVVLDLYWMMVRDDVSLLGESVDLHTIGLRGAGALGAFDFDAEVAYQLGEIEYRDFLWWDNDVDYGAWGVNLEAGYTFDMGWQPRVYAGFAFLEGAGDDDDGWFEEEEPAFNRLFSNWEYSEFLDNTDLSNSFVYRLGLSVMPTECLSLALAGTYIMADQVWEWDGLIFDWEADDQEGLELGLYGDYAYSEDLTFRAGYAHFFTDDGAEDGNMILANGLLPYVEDEDDDYDYVFVETELSF